MLPFRLDIIMGYDNLKKIKVKSFLHAGVYTGDISSSHRIIGCGK
jgi:hypothetical protein